MDGHRDGDANVCEPGTVRTVEVEGRGRGYPSLHAVDRSAILCGLCALQHNAPNTGRGNSRLARFGHCRRNPAGPASSRFILPKAVVCNRQDERCSGRLSSSLIVLVMLDQCLRQRSVSMIAIQPGFLPWCCLMCGGWLQSSWQFGKPCKWCWCNRVEYAGICQRCQVLSSKPTYSRQETRKSAWCSVMQNHWRACSVSHAGVC